VRAMKRIQQKQRHFNSGFTLLEVLLSFTILGFILLVFFQFFGQSLAFSTKNETKLQEVNIAREAMNILQAKSNVVALVKSQIGSNIHNVELSSTTDGEMMNELLHPNASIDSLLKGQYEMVFHFHESPDITPLVQITVRVTSPGQKNSAETYGYIK